MKLLLNYLSVYRWRVVGALALAATNQIFSLMDPYIFRKIIDDVAAVYRSDTHTMEQFVGAIWPLALASVGVAFVSRVAKNFQDYFINTITQKVGANLYSDGIRHSLELPYETFEDQRSGETLGKLQKVRTDVEKLITLGINILFQSIIALIFISVYAFSVHWMVMPLFLITGPLIGYVSSVLSKKIKTIQIEIVKESTGLAGSTTESLRNIELVKSLGLAEQEIAHLNATTEKILKLELKKVRYVRSMAFVQGTCVNLLRMLMVVVLIYLIYEGKITIGQFYSLNIYSFFLFNPLQEIGNVVNTYREAEVSLQNFEQVLSIPSEKKPENPKAISSIQELKFDQVSFKHQSATTEALNGITFSVKGGETIAFVGPSGGGKSTLVNLLPRFYQPKSGRIMLDQIPIEEIVLTDLRKQISFVSQDVILFNDTIAANVAYGSSTSDDIDRGRVIEALEAANLANLLSELPDGIDTPIGDNGNRLSGGQRQRLAIARAIYKDAPILILDEATSALDSESERQVQDALERLMAGRTTLMIAHRLSTIENANRIVVLDHGKIVENGSHAQLIEQNGLYASLHRLQFSQV